MGGAEVDVLVTNTFPVRLVLVLMDGTGEVDVAAVVDFGVVVIIAVFFL